jgi:hypothetical protein
MRSASSGSATLCGSTREVLKQAIWLLSALVALGILGLMIITPTPPKEGGVPPVVSNGRLAP